MAFEKLKRKIYLTRDARFEAYRRMKRRKLSSTVSLALLSISIIVFNIFQFAPCYEVYFNSITGVTIILSVLILAVSLLISNLNYSEKELKYYICGLTLSKLLDDIRCYQYSCSNQVINGQIGDIQSDEEQHHPEVSTQDDCSQIKIFYDQYQKIIGECGINHINIDYKRAQLRDDKSKNDFDKWDKAYIWVEWNILDLNTLYWLLAILIPYVGYYMIFVMNIFENNSMDTLS